MLGDRAVQGVAPGAGYGGVGVEETAGAGVVFASHEGAGGRGAGGDGLERALRVVAQLAVLPDGDDLAGGEQPEIHREPLALPEDDLRRRKEEVRVPVEPLDLPLEGDHRDRAGAQIGETPRVDEVLVHDDLAAALGQLPAPDLDVP